MPASNHLFHTLEPPRTPWNRFAASLVINVGLVVALVLVPIAARQTIRQTVTHEISIVYPRTALPVPSPIIHAQKLPFRPNKVQVPLPEPVIARRPLPPAPQPRPKEFDAPKIEAPKIEASRLPVPKFEIPAPPAPAPARPSVHTDVFAAATPAPAGPKSPDRSVKVGGFGDPNGVPASADASRKGLLVARVGSFDLPQAAGNAGGGGRGHVATAGFGDAGYDSPGASNRGSQGSAGAVVRPAGFNDFQQTAPQSRVIRNTQPAETPVEITYKPKPVYTAEARQRRLEGEVQVEVIFTSSGQVRVLRVVRGLGFGLDQSARAAAEQIRFRPGTRDGVPVDMRGIVHITFELS